LIDVGVVMNATTLFLEQGYIGRGLVIVAQFSCLNYLLIVHLFQCAKIEINLSIIHLNNKTLRFPNFSKQIQVQAMSPENTIDSD